MKVLDSLVPLLFTVLEPPANNFATNGLEKGNFTATVRTKTYPEGTPELRSNNVFRLFPSSLYVEPLHMLVLYLFSKAWLVVKP